MKSEVHEKHLVRIVLEMQMFKFKTAKNSAKRLFGTRKRGHKYNYELQHLT